MLKGVRARLAELQAADRRYRTVASADIRAAGRYGGQKARTYSKEWTLGVAALLAVLVYVLPVPFGAALNWEGLVVAVGAIFTVYAAIFLWHFAVELFTLPHKRALQREATEQDLRLGLAEMTRAARTHELRVELLAGMQDATRSIPPEIEQIRPDVTEDTYSPARNRASMALTGWIRVTVAVLREGGQSDLADAFEVRQGEDLWTQDDYQAAYDRRVALLTPLPDLAVQE
jgi:hypothetical protein